jgi:divalent metal cation (Fe/Co/Zn/Cd) transporter
VSIVFGNIAGSVALIGFGLDSIIESLSGIILIWRLRHHGTVSHEEEERIEKKAMKFVAVSFFVLAAYVFYESAKKLLLCEQPDPSLPGIIIAGSSMIVMPLLAFRKYSIGKQINSKALVADSKETYACFFLSVALLLGLGLNQLFGFWQADPIAGLVIFFFLAKEGREVWQEAHEEEVE